MLRISSDSDDENGTLDVRKPPTREKTIDEQLREIDDSSFADDHDSNDEFDSMISPKGLSDKLGLDDQNKKLLEKPTEEKV